MSKIYTTTVTDPWDWYGVYGSGFAPLTTFFEPPTGCETQWIVGSNEPVQILSGSDGRDNGLPTDYFARCNPYSQSRPGYSPGICTSGQDVVEITEARFPSSVLWLGICCDRFRSPFEDYQIQIGLHVYPGV